MSEGRLAKPQLRDLHRSYVKKGLVGVLITGFLTAAAFKALIADIESNKIDNFYKTYDPMKSLEKMENAGLMDSRPQQ
ncbi:cytochrome c oxidase subunit cyclope isoform X2 [Calliopsis andreniformis]